MSDCSWASVAPYSALPKPPNSTVAVVDGDLRAAQVAVGDLVVVQHRAATPTPGAPGSGRRALVERRSARRGVRVQRPAAVERRRPRSSRCWRRRGRRWRWPSARDARRRGASRSAAGRSRWCAAAACARTDAARRRCVGCGPYNSTIAGRGSGARSAARGRRQHQRSRPGRAGPPSAPTPQTRAGPAPAPRRRAAPPARGCRRPARPARRRTSRPPGPSSDRAGTTALTTRWIGTNASSSAHHQRRQRAGSHGPDTVSTAASIAIQRGSSRNWDSTVSSRSDRSKCHRGRGDAVAGDRQRRARRAAAAAA